MQFLRDNPGTAAAPPGEVLAPLTFDQFVFREKKNPDPKTTNEWWHTQTPDLLPDGRVPSSVIARLATMKAAIPLVARYCAAKMVKGYPEYIKRKNPMGKEEIVDVVCKQVKSKPGVLSGELEARSKRESFVNQLETYVALLEQLEPIKVRMQRLTMLLNNVVTKKKPISEAEFKSIETTMKRLQWVLSHYYKQMLICQSHALAAMTLCADPEKNRAVIHKNSRLMQINLDRIEFILAFYNQHVHKKDLIISDLGIYERIRIRVIKVSKFLWSVVKSKMIVNLSLWGLAVAGLAGVSAVPAALMIPGSIYAFQQVLNYDFVKNWLASRSWGRGFLRVQDKLNYIFQVISFIYTAANKGFLPAMVDSFLYLVATFCAKKLDPIATCSVIYSLFNLVGPQMYASVGAKVRGLKGKWDESKVQEGMFGGRVGTVLKQMALCKEAKTPPTLQSEFFDAVSEEFQQLKAGKAPTAYVPDDPESQNWLEMMSIGFTYFKSALTVMMDTLATIFCLGVFTPTGLAPETFSWIKDVPPALPTSLNIPGAAPVGMQQPLRGIADNETLAGYVSNVFGGGTQTANLTSSYQNSIAMAQNVFAVASPAAIAGVILGSAVVIYGMDKFMMSDKLPTKDAQFESAEVLLAMYEKAERLNRKVGNWEFQKQVTQQQAENREKLIEDLNQDPLWQGVTTDLRARVQEVLRKNPETLPGKAEKSPTQLV